MKRMLYVARREFVATAMTKGFIIGAFVVPAVILAAMAVLFPILFTDRAPRVVGSFAIVDHTAELITGVRARLTPEAITERESGTVRKAQEQIAEATEGLGLEGVSGMGGPGAATAMLGSVLGDIPQIEVIELPVDTDLEEAKAPLVDGDPFAGGRLGLAIINEFAVKPNDADGEYGAYELFVVPKLDDRVVSILHESVRETVRETRIRNAGWEPGELDALTTVRRPRAIEVSAEGEHASMGELGMLMPAAFMFLLMISVMVGGQYLLTTTIEEKSSRVVEVLLSAVSPRQLMTGKIVGQMGVGLLMLVIYGGVGGGALIFLSLRHLIDPLAIVYLLIFFFIAYFFIASFMAAIGSAVNEMREAQSLMTPVMLALMIPYLLWMPITRNPSGTFATVVSFVPPVNPFVMMLRITSTEPPPTWQILLSIAVGIAAAYVAVWFAAKVFRVGLLMYGKPPNLRTLIRWVRMA